MTKPVETYLLFVWFLCGSVIILSVQAEPNDKWSTTYTSQWTRANCELKDGGEAGNQWDIDSYQLHAITDHNSKQQTIHKHINDINELGQ